MSNPPASGSGPQDTPSDDFSAAKQIYEMLKSISGDRQARVLRWVGEGLGIAPAQASATAVNPLTTPADPVAAAIPVVISDKHPSLQEFCEQKKPDNDIQFSVVVAYWYKYKAQPASRRDTIDKATIENAFREANRPIPKNPIFTLNNAKKNGYFESRAKGEFAIINFGENLVTMTLGAGGSQVDESPQKKRRAKAKRPRKAK